MLDNGYPESKRVGGEIDFHMMFKQYGKSDEKNHLERLHLETNSQLSVRDFFQPIPFGTLTLLT